MKQYIVYMFTIIAWRFSMYQTEANNGEWLNHTTVSGTI